MVHQFMLEFILPKFALWSLRWTKIVKKSLIVEPKDVLKLLERAKTSTPKSLQPQLWNLKNCDFVQKPKYKVFGENHKKK